MTTKGTTTGTAKTTGVTTGTAKTTATTAVTSDTAVAANPATMNPSELSIYSLTVTMNQAQLQNFLATHSSGAATAGATGTSVASGASGASLEDSTTTTAAAAAGGNGAATIDDTTKGLTFVTSRTLKPSSSATSQGSAQALGSGSNANQANAAGVYSTNSVLVFVSICIGFIGGSLGI